MVNLTNDEHQRLCDLAKRAEAAESRVAGLQKERDEWKRRFALNEHVAADLRNIRGLVKAPENINTFDAVGIILRERDELRARLEQAQHVINEA